MDVWAPTFRWPADGTTRITSVIGTVAVFTNTAFIPTGAAADAAGYASPGGLLTNAYGEVAAAAMSNAGSKLGFLFRYVDTSNYYAAYLTSTGANVDSMVGGVLTNILTLAFTLPLLTPPLTFRAEILDGAITVHWRGVPMGRVQDSSLTGPGFTCLYLRGQSAGINAQAVGWETGPFFARHAPPLNQQPGPRRTASRLR
jgi:hypothetical protein